MKLTTNKCTEILRHVSETKNLGLGQSYKATGLYEYLRENTNPDLLPSRCEQIIVCIVHNYRPNSKPMTGKGLAPESWEDWLRNLVGAEPQTYEEYANENMVV
jgi:hypothetical protein